MLKVLEPNSGDTVNKPCEMYIFLVKHVGVTDLTVQDIRGLLADWSDEIADCERIWIRASTSNRRIFLDDYTDSVIKKG